MAKVLAQDQPAANHGNVVIVKFSRRELIRQLLAAAAVDDCERARYLLDGCGLSVDSYLPGKPSALCYAAIKGNESLTDYLIGRGADVNFADGMGQTPLIYATLGGHVRILHRLLQHGADPLHCNNADKTAFTYACQQRTACCTNVLLGATYNSRCSQLGLPEHFVDLVTSIDIDKDRM